MSKARDTLLSLTLLALVFTGPAAVAAYLLSGEPAELPLMLAAAGTGTSAPADEPPKPGSTPSAAPVLAGVLYTRGTAQVDWNGEKISVADGSYAYLGGEVVSNGPGDMGVLRLDENNSVYMCPGSRMSVDRTDGGGYRIKIFQGGGRFAFAAGTDYRIEANQGVLSPGADAASQPTVVEVTVFQDHPGGVVCGFSSSSEVAAYSSDGSGEPIALGTAGPGEIIDLSRALDDEAVASGAPVVMHAIPMPESVQGWLRDNAPYPPEPGPIGYLCRCEELKRYAEADGIPDEAIPPRMSPPDSQALAILPPVVLAVPTLPDPGVSSLPTDTGPVLTVPPPLVPAAGSGGGVTSTPS